MAQLTKYDRPSTQPISNLRREMDRIFNELIPFNWRLEEPEMGISSWTPRTDMMENDDEYVIQVDLPGMAKDHIDINVHDNMLTIEGERHEESREEGSGYLRSERSFGAFKRSFSLPSHVVGDKVKASFKNGVLTVHLPKAEKSKRKKVTID